MEDFRKLRPHLPFGHLPPQAGAEGGQASGDPANVREALPPPAGEVPAQRAMGVISRERLDEAPLRSAGDLRWETPASFAPICPSGIFPRRRGKGVRSSLLSASGGG